MFNLGYPELLVLCALGILLFGKKLPDIARSLGKSVIAFKQGLSGIEAEVEQSVARASEPAAPRTPERLSVSAPERISADALKHNDSMSS